MQAIEWLAVASAAAPKRFIVFERRAVRQLGRFFLALLECFNKEANKLN